MSQLSKTIERQGVWLVNAIQILQDHNPLEVIPALYDLEIVEQYILEKRMQLKSEIISALSKKVCWSDTGESFEFDKDFFSYYLGFIGDIKFFKSQLSRGKIPTTKMVEMHKKLVVEPAFREM